MFVGETIAALQIIDRGDLTPSEMVGSWAGELGQTQFFRRIISPMPSTMTATAAAISCAARRRDRLDRKLHRRRIEMAPWRAVAAGSARRAQPDAGFSLDQADLTIQLPRSKWAQLGVTMRRPRIANDDLPASLLLPMAAWPIFLAYANFSAYTNGTTR